MCKLTILFLFIFSGASVGCASLVADSANETITMADGWQQYHDQRLGFILEHPVGWKVQTQGYTILAQSAERSTLVMVEAFAARPGETAQTRVSGLSNLHPALFPAAHLDRIAQQPSQGDQVVGAFSYKNARGQLVQARVLCLIYQGSGMLYVLSAPSDSFGNERSTLLRVLTSIRFGVAPNTTTATGNRRGSAKAGLTAANGELRFVRWNDPKEHAYSVEVPEGWTVEGGAYRVEPSDVRMMSRLTSPDKDMMVQAGNQNFPTMFIVPTPLMRRTYRGVPEGVAFSPNHMSQMMLLRYMPALEYNKWYLDQSLKPAIEDLSINRESELPEPAQRLNEQMSVSLR